MNSLWHALSNSTARALHDSFLGRLFFFAQILKSLTYVDQCASLKEFNKLKCRGLFHFFLSEQKKLMRQV